MGKVFLALAFGLAGSSVVAMRYVSEKMGPFSLTACVLGIALLSALPAWGGIANAAAALTRRQWMRVFLQALFGILLFRIFLLSGLRFIGTAEAGILTGATPAATALLGWLMLREPMGKGTVAGVTLTVCGVLLLQGIGGLSSAGPGAIGANAIGANALKGSLLVLGAALCESVFSVLSRSGSLQAQEGAERETDPLVQAALVAGVALLLCLPPALLEGRPPSMAGLGLTEWLALVWLGAFVTILSYVFWFAGIRRCRSYTAAAFSGLVPLSAVALSVLLLGETLSPPQLAGGALVIAGMGLIR